MQRDDCPTLVKQQLLRRRQPGVDACDLLGPIAQIARTLHLATAANNDKCTSSRAHASAGTVCFHRATAFREQKTTLETIFPTAQDALLTIQAPNTSLYNTHLAIVHGLTGQIGVNGHRSHDVADAL